MNKVLLGKSVLSVSAIGLGCMGMSSYYGVRTDKKEMISLIRAAVEQGITLYDTAEVYGPFINEELVGEALAPFKNMVTIATKFGFKQPANINNTWKDFDSSASNIVKVVEASLKRLRIDCIDLLYQHRVDPNIPPEEVAGTVQELVKQGKVKYFGLSKADEIYVRRAHKVHPVTAVQSEYSLLSGSINNSMLTTLEELGIGFVAYSPLGKGFLSGSIKDTTHFNRQDLRSSNPKFTPEAIRNNYEIVKLLSEIAKTRHATPAQVSLAWILAQSPNIVPIPGTTNLERLKENINAIQIKLSSDEMNQLNEIRDQILIQDLLA